MALETLLVFAKATGRTVVLPPSSPIYLLKSKRNATTSAAAAASGGRAAAAAAPPTPLASAVDFFREGVAALQRNKVLNVVTFEAFVEAESRGPGGVVFDAASRMQRAVQLQPGWGAARGRADGVGGSDGNRSVAVGGVGAAPADARELLLAWNAAAEQVRQGCSRC
jgi:hypothetical protein